MENLTTEQKKDLVKEILDGKSIAEIGSFTCMKLGRMAADMSASVKFSMTNKSTGRTYRMVVTSSSDTPADVRDNQYLIRMRLLSPRTNLDNLLADAFGLHDSSTIGNADIAELQAIYNHVMNQYRSTGGKHHLDFNQRTGLMGDIHVRIGDKINIDLLCMASEFYNNIDAHNEEIEE